MQKALRQAEEYQRQVVASAKASFALAKARPWLAAALVTATALAAGYFLYGRGTPVTVVPATRGTAAEIVYATGSVEPVQWARVASVIRDRIVEICDCEGRQVKQGEVVARLDDREEAAQLVELRAREEFAKRELARQTELMSRGVSSTQAYERVSMDLRAIEALIMVQHEKIVDRRIVAPIDGVVLRRDGEVGEIAEVGQILFRIGVTKPLRVVAEVSEEDITRVAVGQQVLFRSDAFADRNLEGRVSELTPMGDAIAKTYRIKVALPDDTPLKPGMSVEANIVSREKPDALVVPADALQGKHVFVVDDGRLRRRQVEIGVRGGRAVELLSGVKEGERVASPAASELKDGQRVRAVEAVSAKP